MTRKTVCYVPGCGYQDPDLIRFVAPTIKLMDMACAGYRPLVFSEILYEYDQNERSGVGLFDYAGMPIAARIFENQKREIIECWIEFNTDSWMWRVYWRGDKEERKWDFSNLEFAFNRWADLVDAPFNPLTFGRRYELENDDGDEYEEPKPVVAKTPTPRPETYGTWS